MEEPRKRARPGRSPAPAGRTARPRQAEVARLAGVSQATVSLVLADKKQGATISEETRQKVLEAARSLGYVPDPAARSDSAAARNNLLGVFSFTATFPTDVQHSYYPFLVGVEREAAERGYDLVLFTGSSTGGAGAAGPDALSRVRLADGCLFLGRHAPAQELQRLVADGFPVVHLGRRDELEGLAWVGADYVSASREVVARLAALGHRRILLIREDDEAPASTDREHGFLKGLEAAGLPGGPETVFRFRGPGTRPIPRTAAGLARRRRHRACRRGDRHRSCLARPAPCRHRNRDRLPARRLAGAPRQPARRPRGRPRTHRLRHPPHPTRRGGCTDARRAGRGGGGHRISGGLRVPTRRDVGTTALGLSGLTDRTICTYSTGDL